MEGSSRPPGEDTRAGHAPRRERLADIGDRASGVGHRATRVRPEYSARRMLLLAQRRAAEQEMLCCQKELAAYEARTELLPLCRDLDARQVALAEQEIKQRQEFVNRRRQQEAEQQVRQAAWEAGQAHPAVRRLAEENAALAAKRKQLAERIVDTTRQQEQVNQQLSDAEGPIQAASGKGRGGGKDERHQRHRPDVAEAARGACPTCASIAATSACGGRRSARANWRCCNCRTTGRRWPISISKRRP